MFCVWKLCDFIRIHYVCVSCSIRGTCGIPLSGRILDTIRANRIRLVSKSSYVYERVGCVGVEQYKGGNGECE